MLSTAKPGVPGLFSADRIWCADPSGPLSHFFKVEQAIQVSVCVQTHLNEFLSLHLLCYISFSGFPVAVSWTELTVHNITYLLCRLYSSGELVSANLLLLHFQRPVNCISSSIAGECQIKISIIFLFTLNFWASVSRSAAFDTYFVLWIVCFLCRNSLCQYPILATLRAVRSLKQMVVNRWWQNSEIRLWYKLWGWVFKAHSSV